MDGLNGLNGFSNGFESIPVKLMVFLRNFIDFYDGEGVNLRVNLKVTLSITYSEEHRSQASRTLEAPQHILS